jgi:hypothetical protein
MTEYGIWNVVTRRFVLGIRESDQDAAWRRFHATAPDYMRRGPQRQRYKAMQIPRGHNNKKNRNWR